MITQVAKKISYFFAKKSIIDNEEIELYTYSFEMLLATLTNLMAIIFVAIIFDKITETAIYLLAFFPLRIVAGGYHADNHFRCTTILIVTYLLILLILNLSPKDLIAIETLCSIIISLILIFVLAPIEDKNNPMTQTQIKKFRAKSRICIVLYLIVISLLIILEKEYWAFILSLGTLSVGLSLLACKIKNYIKAH